MSSPGPVAPPAELPAPPSPLERALAARARRHDRAKPYDRPRRLCACGHGVRVHSAVDGCRAVVARPAGEREDSLLYRRGALAWICGCESWRTS